MVALSLFVVATVTFNVGIFDGDGAAILLFLLTDNSGDGSEFVDAKGSEIPSNDITGSICTADTASSIFSGAFCGEFISDACNLDRKLRIRSDIESLVPDVASFDIGFFIGDGSRFICSMIYSRKGPDSCCKCVSNSVSPYSNLYPRIDAKAASRSSPGGAHPKRDTNDATSLDGVIFGGTVLIVGCVTISVSIVPRSPSH